MEIFNCEETCFKMLLTYGPYHYKCSDLYKSANPANALEGLVYSLDLLKS